MTALDALRAGLRAIDQQVAAGQYGEARPWSGAGVVITEAALPSDRPGEFYPTPRTVVTPHARTLSWLFEQLWDVFRPAMDHITKFEFFGRLAHAASRYQAQTADAGTERDLLGAVAHEAYAILDALSGGTFSAPSITSGGVIYDDAVLEHERGRYVSVEEADSGLSDSGHRAARTDRHTDIVPGS